MNFEGLDPYNVLGQIGWTPMCVFHPTPRPPRPLSAVDLFVPRSFWWRRRHYWPVSHRRVSTSIERAARSQSNQWRWDWRGRAGTWRTSV